MMEQVRKASLGADHTFFFPALLDTEEVVAAFHVIFVELNQLGSAFEVYHGVILLYRRVNKAPEMLKHARYFIF